MKLATALTAFNVVAMIVNVAVLFASRRQRRLDRARHAEILEQMNAMLGLDLAARALLGSRGRPPPV